MSTPKLVKVGVVAGACAAVGAGAGILGSAGAASSGAHGAQTPGKHRLARPLRRAVHADAVVPVRGGRFVNVTLDRGIVQSVSGDKLTLVEGTRKASYKTVTLTIPANAKVRDNGQLSQLSAVKAGQRAFVFQGPKHTRVGAHDVRTH